MRCATRERARDSPATGYSTLARITSDAPQADRFLQRRAERDSLRVQLALFRLYCLDQQIRAENVSLEVRPVACASDTAVRPPVW